MSGCLDKLNCRCGCLDPALEWLKPKRNMIASVVAGTLFAVGWWFAIDACAERAEPVYAAFHICGIFSTIALLMFWIFAGSMLFLPDRLLETYTQKDALGEKVLYIMIGIDRTKGQQT
ncbi:Transmembrane protein 50B [Geodia barretti]|uniref:Transmembrane protein 50B n=1 Tax=Geodia barretti TaxID=519541 RepID=A0AA35TTR7_GEOBA|nr:Transmembrane protein 50B [Geodia barretti]